MAEYGYFLASEEFGPHELVEQASSLVTEEMVADSVPCGPDPDVHVAALGAFAEAGFDRMYVSRIGPDQRDFFDFYRTKVLPQLRNGGGR